MQFLNYTDKITFVTNCEENKCEISSEKIKNLKNAGIPIYIEKLSKVIGKDGIIAHIKLENGTQIKTDFLFSLQGAVPNTRLAKTLDIKLNKDGYILIDSEQRTNIPTLVFGLSLYI